MRLMAFASSLGLMFAFSASADQIQILVDHGNRVDTYRLHSSENRAPAHFTHAVLGDQDSQVDPENFNSIQKRFEEIAKLDPKASPCQPDSVKVKVNGLRGEMPSFCLTEDSSRAQSLRNLLNTLSIAY